MMARFRRLSISFNGATYDSSSSEEEEEEEEATTMEE